MDRRVNTVKVQLKEGSPKPTELEMVKFVIVNLGMKAEELVGVQQNPGNDGIIYIKCYEEAIMRKIIEDFDGTFFKYENGSVTRVQMTEANEVVRYVRVFGLPFEVDDREVEIFFGHYGIVKRMVRERFPNHFNLDIWSGVRGVYIDLKREIPAFLYIRGVRVKVHYYGMRERCHICNAADHMKSECPSRPPAITPESRLKVTENMTNLNSLFKKNQNQIEIASQPKITPPSTDTVTATTTITEEPRPTTMTSIIPTYSTIASTRPTPSSFGYSHSSNPITKGNATLDTSTMASFPSLIFRTNTSFSTTPKPSTDDTVVVQVNDKEPSDVVVSIDDDMETENQHDVMNDEEMENDQADIRLTRKARKSPTPDKGPSSRDASNDSLASTSMTVKKKVGRPKRQKFLPIQTIADELKKNINNEQNK
jgi:hypothetical protein